MPEQDLKDKIIQALKENADPKPDALPSAKLKKSLFYRVAALAAFATLCTVLFLSMGNALLSPHPVSGPWGEISSPAYGSVTDNEVRVSAETRNIEPGQYLWLAVDKPDLSLCWPKNPVHGNIGFNTVIDENGPIEAYTLSLYAVNKTIHDQWTEWVGQKRLGGLPMPSEKRRLDSVRLVLGG